MTNKLSTTSVTRLLSRYGSIVMLTVLVVLMSFTSKEFLTIHNLTNVVRQVSIFAIIGTGMTFVIITAGIDLSVGSLLALTACAAMTVIDETGMDYLGIGVGLVIGALAGVANGVVIARFKVPPFIATLAGLTVFRGAPWSSPRGSRSSSSREVSGSSARVWCGAFRCLSSS